MQGHPRLRGGEQTGLGTLTILGPSGDSGSGSGSGSASGWSRKITLFLMFLH